MQLFFDSKVEFRKVAAETQLPEDPNAWPHEILQELYKQVPYVADFSPHVVMTTVDGEQGYGMGFVEVANQTEIQTATSPEASAAAGVRKVRIPVVIKDGMLSPFDLLVTDDSKVRPLTEARLRAAIFRPQSFDVTSRTPGDQSMIGQLYPPYRQSYGFGGSGLAMNVGMGKEGQKESSALEHFLIHSDGKEASALDKLLLEGAEQGSKLLLNRPNTLSAKADSTEKTTKTAAAIDDYMATEGVRQTRFGKKVASGAARLGMLGEFVEKNAAARSNTPLQGFTLHKTGSLLRAILPTISDSDLWQFRQAVADPEVRTLIHKNAAVVSEPVKLILEAPRAKLASISDLVRPSVVQLSRMESDYRVKAASHLYWEPVTERIDRAQAVRRFGEKVVLAADLAGSVTMADGADEAGEVAEDPMQGASPINAAGVYRVETVNGDVVEGHVIPNLIDVNGTVVPIALFTDGEHAAVQSDVLGVPVEGGAPLAGGGTPNGRGIFFADGPQGLQATVPMTISGSMAGMAENEPTLYKGKSFSGEEVLVSLQPNIVKPVATGEGELLVPESWQWLPLDQADEIALASQEEQVGSEAKHAAALATVDIVSDGQTFSFRGRHVEKLAHAERESVGLDAAMFLLAGLGVAQNYAIEKLAEATTGAEPIPVRVGRELELAATKRAEANAGAIEALEQLPQLKTYLWKEAAAMTDPTSVDAVLSLGFLNPENLMTFISYLPVIEDAQSKMCDILLASRLGKLVETPEGAIERAVRSTEAVLEGLKALAFQTN